MPRKATLLVVADVIKPGRLSRAEDESFVNILATLVPDEIIYSDVVERSIVGVLFFVDVSGFTDLCEKYSRIKGGPSRITQVLNEYIGAMVQEIITHNGDILKFSGDAFIALWKSSDELSMSEVIHAALDCALNIQRSHGTYKTEVGITLHVKIAVACGHIVFSLIGGDRNNYMILGSAMFDVKELGNHCGPGDIYISNHLKYFLGPNDYNIENVSNSPHAKVVSIGSEWIPNSLSTQYDLFDAFGLSKEEHRDESESNITLLLEEEKTPNHTNIFSMRPSIDYSVSHHLYNYIKKFIIPPVIRAINLNEPLEYLTEMRQVVIVFINIVTQSYRIENLIQICNDTHDIIYLEVLKYGGCLNKVSMFDKDLMYLVIFGLRGFKHTLEAQRALYCSRTMREILAEVKNVESASIGVCSGKTYCGVIGHPLRQEYTVIGRNVNKAARLMVAYPNMVSCDYQTFLSSQLQARYFILQPERYLKGFSNVGPIYKFDDQTSEEEMIAKEMLKTYKYPIVNFHKEIEIFFSIIVDQIDNSEFLDNMYSNTTNTPLPEEYHMLVVKGKQRQGKTRFLNEISYHIGDYFENYYCSYCPSTMRNYKIFQHMFNIPCKLVKQTNMELRTQSVYDILHPFKVPEFLCALNEILNVDFEVTKYYLRLSENQKLFVKSKMIKYLCVKLFRDKCVVLVDNINLMEEESWMLLKEVLKSGIVIFCATMETYANLSDGATDILERSDVLSIEMGKISKFYMNALTCQFLNVLALPLELERFIQLYSNGNPGWIESFLTTLTQSEVIRTLIMPKTNAIEEGYVIPQYNYIHRDDDEQNITSSLQHIDSKEGSFISELKADIEDWALYRQTIIEHDMEMYDKFPEEMFVCVVTNESALGHIETEDVLDVAMLKIYDYLKVHEQQLLKCCSILGDSFIRSMLEYVLQTQSVRNTAMAIKKLFEIRVLACGRGRYVNGAIKINHFLSNPNERTSIKCFCIDFPINPATKDLPKYANCGYLRFREPAFRQMLYNLLTENQANLYHIRAMWYLENETRRCLDCGLGYFSTFLGHTYDDGMKMFTVDLALPPPQMTKLRQSVLRPDFSSGYVSRSSMMRSSIRTSMIPQLHDDEDKAEENVDFIEDPDEYERKPWSADDPMLHTLNQFEKVTNIGVISDVHIRTFSDNNLKKCACESILITMYKQMLEHCQETENNEKLLNVILEYATLNIKSQNTTVALALLEKATHILNSKLKFEYAHPKWEIPLANGRIMLLYSLLHMERHAYQEAEKCFLISLKHYKVKFPKSKIATKTTTKLNELKQYLKVELFPHRYLGSKDENTCLLANRISEVLFGLYVLYRRTMQYSKAYLASVWCLNEALRADSNFYIMCNAFANIMTIDLIYRRTNIVDTLEEMALKMCFRKIIRLEKHELDAVVRLYSTIFCRKCLSFNMVESLKLGSIVVQLNSPEFGGTYRCNSIPLMMLALVFTYVINHAALLIIHSSCFVKIFNRSNYGLLMYYTMCIEFRFYTSHCIEPFSKCTLLVNNKFITNVNDYSSIIEIRYHIALWLWYIKKNNWISADNIVQDITCVKKWKFIKDPTMVYVILHILEGCLLLSIRYLTTCDVVNFKKIKSLILYLFKYLKTAANKLLCIKARYLLLLSYWYTIQEKQSKAIKILDMAFEEAKNCNIYFEMDWIDYTKELWTLKSRHHISDEWQEATDQENIFTNWEFLENSEIEIPYFSLLPPFVSSQPTNKDIEN